MTDNVFIRFGIILFLICLISSALLSGAYFLTKPRIEAQKKAAEAQSLSFVMPQAKGGFETVEENGEILHYKGFTDKAKKQLLGYVFKAQGRGYSSRIEILAGVTLDGKITGIKILSQEETPGLGERITEVVSKKTLFDVLKKRHKGAISEERRPWFCEQFRGKSVDELVAVKGKTQRNIEAITGATITSEAVVDAVRERAKEMLKEQKVK